MIKQNIKIRVTPEQSKKIQEICFYNGVFWVGNKNTIQREDQKYLYIIDGHIDFGATYEYFEKYDVKEIDADLFIRTNGSCEEKEEFKYPMWFKNKHYDIIVKFSSLYNCDVVESANKDFPVGLSNRLSNHTNVYIWEQVEKPNTNDEEYTKLEKKVFNLKKQLEKYVVKIANQKEEIIRLLSQKEDLQNRLNTANRTVGMSINNDIKLIRLLEEKDAIIKYLESKLEI